MVSGNSIIGILWLIFLVYWLVPRTGAKKTIRGKGYWYYLVGARIVAIVVLVAFFNVPVLRQALVQGSVVAPSLAADAAGVLLCALGFGFAAWARVHLGRNWGAPGTAKENQELVTSGPYRFVRHPIYSGGLLAMLGSSLVGGSLWLFVFIASLPVLVYSAIREEKLVTKQFPDTYPEYRARTKMLIPFVL